MQDCPITHWVAMKKGLKHKLFAVSAEIAKLRQQQHIIIKLPGPSQSRVDSPAITRTRWVSILESDGLDEDGMSKWHAEFERSAPQAHQDFLESIGIEGKEIVRIREYARAPDQTLVGSPSGS